LISTILDTGPLAAAINSRDRNHARCAEFLASLRGRQILPISVVMEVCWLFEDSPKLEADFLHTVVVDPFEVTGLSRKDLSRVRELVLRYADFPLGAVDASVVALAERLGVDRVATLDRRHFSVIRPSHVPAFVLVP
jgi:predicted nucleic acid-binding protein